MVGGETHLVILAGSSMKLLSELVAIPSQSGKEQIIQRFIAGYLKTFGFVPQLVKENLIFHIAGKKQQSALIFNAHVDTVSAGDVLQWEHNPFAGKVVGNKVYGLGASDEKAGVASLLLLAEAFKRQPPPHDVWLQFVVREEQDGSGTRETMEWFMGKGGRGKAYRKLAAILVEPTGLATMELGHKGNVFLKLTVTGDSGHGSEPRKIKTHAVLVMVDIFARLLALEETWQGQYGDSILGKPTIGVATSISAGSQESPNKFPDTCTATVDIRTTPALHAQVLDLVRNCLAGYPVTVDYLYPPAPFGLTKKSAAIVQVFQQVCPGVELGVSKGSTDQCFFTQYGIPAVIFGPGEKECIHQPNECCEVAKITKAVGIYQRVIQKWLAVV